MWWTSTRPLSRRLALFNSGSRGCHVASRSSQVASILRNDFVDHDNWEKCIWHKIETASLRILISNAAVFVLQICCCCILSKRHVCRCCRSSTVGFEEISNSGNHLRKLRKKGAERMCIPKFRDTKVALEAIFLERRPHCAIRDPIQRGRRWRVVDGFR